MNFKSKRGLGSRSDAANISMMKGFIARKVKESAEKEIQKILSEVESRIRQAVAQNIECRIGDLEYVQDSFSDKAILHVNIHVLDTKCGAGFNPAICISEPDKFTP